MLCNKDVKSTTLAQHMILKHKLIMLYINSMPIDDYLTCPNQYCNLNLQKFMTQMDYSLALHTLIHCNESSTRTKFLRELRVIRVHNESMAKVNIISGDEAKEAEKWLRKYQNEEAPWDMPGLTASSHSDDSDDSDTEVFKPPSTNTKHTDTSVEDLVGDGERSRLKAGIR